MEEPVRRLGPEDAAVAREVVRRLQGREPSEEGLRERLADASNALWVAELDGVPVGFVWAHWLARLGREAPQLFVYEIEVDAGHRRRGVGRRLLSAALAAARARRADAFLLTNRSNPGAVAFYEALGGRTKTGDDLLYVFPCEPDA